VSKLIKPQIARLSSGYEDWAALNENFIALGFRENERKVGCEIGLSSDLSQAQY
jgi:hypothetical protein